MENTIEFKSIGTHWWITIFDTIDKSNLSEITNSVKELTSDFENKYSRFLEDSLVSKLNRGESLEFIPEDLSNMLNLSEKVRLLTDGHFNINIGSTLENYGYDFINFCRK